MKRLLTIVLFLTLSLSLCVLPTAAESFSPNGTDFTLDIDTGMWYVFTPDNIENNPELEELGITYEYMKNFFQTSAAHLNGLLVFLDSEKYLELVVRSNSTDDVINLAPCTRDDLEDFAEVLREESNSTYSDIWENEYNFVIIELFDETTQLYGRVYTTVVNSEIYVFTFTTPEPLDDQDREIADEIMKTASFRVEDPSKKFPDKGFF